MSSELRAYRAEKLRRLYLAEPEAYASDVLKVLWWEAQCAVAQAFAQSGSKILVPASHGVGKTFLGGGLVNYHFDLFNPGITLTTAPTKRQVVNLLWKEVRKQRRGRPGLLPKSPRMETSAEHFAEGYTAIDGNAFQGLHAEAIAAFFDEACGVDGQIWEATEGILAGGETRQLCIFNPTDVSSRAHEEDISGTWTRIRISALDHPNIIASLAGRPEPFPGAVSLRWVEDKLTKWCERTDHLQPGDIEFPPASGVYYRPGPLFESRVIGRWPSQGFDTIWSEGLWDSCFVLRPIPTEALQIGCDVARFGDDWTVICVRRGRAVLHLERHNGWSLDMTAGRIKQLAAEFAEEGEDPKEVLCTIDDDGVGGGVVDMADGFNFRAVKSGHAAFEPERFPNRRSELWYTTRDRAAESNLDLSRLTSECAKILRKQLLGAKWKPDSQGRRVVESKEEMKRRLKKNNPDLMGGSPDDADALNLAFALPSGWTWDWNQ